MKVLISHPFSGALYAFFEAHNEARLRAPSPREPHPYYRTLYGDAFPRYQEMALTLALLFEEIVLVPADVYLPGGHWKADGTYYNSDLGLYTEWDVDLQRELDEKIVHDLEDEEIRRVLARVPPLARQQILRDSRHEIHLAQKYGCPIICVGGRRRIIERILRGRPAGPGPYSARSLEMTEEYLRIVGPIFELRDIGTLVDLRKNPDLRTYAGAFTAAMEGFQTSKDVRADLLTALRDAMASAKLAKRLSGVFDGTATALSVIGLIPVLGTVAAVAGLGAEGAVKGLERRERSQSWFEFAAQVKRVASMKQLERRVSEELAKVADEN